MKDGFDAARFIREGSIGAEGVTIATLRMQIGELTDQVDRLKMQTEIAHALDMACGRSESAVGVAATLVPACHRDGGNGAIVHPTLGSTAADIAATLVAS